MGAPQLGDYLLEEDCHHCKGNLYEPDHTPNYLELKYANPPACSRCEGWGREIDWTDYYTDYDFYFGIK